MNHSQAIHEFHQAIDGFRNHHLQDDVPEKIDIIDVFRRPSAVAALAEEAVRKGFKVFWMQPGTESPEAIVKLDREGYRVVAGRCAKIESSRLL